MEQRSALSELLRRPRTPPDWGQKFTLWVHDDLVSTMELIVNPQLFPNAVMGDVLALSRDQNTAGKLFVKVSSLDNKIFKQRAFQVHVNLLQLLECA